MEEKLTFLRVSELNIDVLEQGLSELFFAVYSTKRDPAFWRWRYLYTPFGNSILIVALRGSRVVGMYGLLYVSLTVQGSTVIGGLMRDLSIHPSEKSWRCYSGLVKMIIVESQKDNLAFHFGVVPARSTKLHQRIGVVALGQLPIYLGFLNFARILEESSVPYPLSLLGWFAYPIRGLRSRCIKEIDLEIRSVENFDSAVDELWSSLVENSKVSVIKNSAYLNWRYGKRSGYWLRRLVAYRDKRLEGLVIFCVVRSRNDGSVLELMARDNNTEIMKALLLQALAELRTKRIAHVRASFPTESRQTTVLKELGFKSWGRFYFVPVLIVASLSKEPSLALDMKNWDFSLGDWAAP